MPPIYVLASYPIYTRQGMHSQFAAAMAAPGVAGAVLQCFQKDVAAGDFSDIDFGLGCLKPGQDVIIAVLPLPCADGVPAVMIAGDEYPLAWQAPAITAYLSAVQAVRDRITAAGVPVCGARVVPSIASVTPCGAAFGYFSSDPSAAQAWAAAGWGPDEAIEGLVQTVTGMRALLPGAALSLPVFSPGIGLDIQADGTLSAVDHMAFSIAAFTAAAAAAGSAGLYAMDMTLEAAAVDATAMKFAGISGRFAVQLQTTGKQPQVNVSGWVANALGINAAAWVELHQDQVGLLPGNAASGPAP